MKTAVLFVIFGFIAVASSEKATACSADKCKLPACLCYNEKPALDEAKIPQLVLISSDDAVTKLIFDTYYKPAYFGRKNPNGCQIGATFFVPHEYSDYSKVHELYANGFEIGVNSITRNPESQYWKEANVSLLEQEFGGQKEILTKFAMVPADTILGVRVPNLQLSGDNTFDAMAKGKLTYDNSWATQKEGIWPYTLDYKSDQDCPVEPCPANAHKGIWISPLNSWIDSEGVICSTVYGCQTIPDETPEILAWFKQNFVEVYNSTKAPFNVVLNSGVIQYNENFFAAYLQFLDYLGTLKDVFIVNISQAIQWSQHPKSKDDKNIFGECFKPKPHADKNAKNCRYKKNEEETRYMNVYTLKCPKSYPWLGNPAGN